MPEGKLLKCPTCAATLPITSGQAEVKCPYCGNTVVVPQELRQADAAGTHAANPINIVMNGSGTSIEIADLNALRPPAIDMNLGNQNLSAPILIPVSQPLGDRWMSKGLWWFIAIMFVVTIVPVVCTLLAVFGSLSSFLPFLFR